LIAARILSADLTHLKGFRIGVVVIEKGVDRGLELVDAAMPIGHRAKREFRSQRL
jgi:hypothetical protein